MLKKVK